MILLGHLLGPEFIDSNISLLMGMTREGSIYEACGTFCRLLWVAINRGVVPGAGIEPARYFYRGILSPLRLPISPPGLSVYTACRDPNRIIRSHKELYGIKRGDNFDTDYL